ncbi:hypothetical protein EGW08_006701 [Elysia chlorotica]|uniref:FAS1 domain-containing protein n=1 Tax=Elysia chlorotica TaxID=188477 RepID=A0A3S1C819_ELYCH|nr:hypothetical protein EGW08_006701 [Elysia chlorotica]
MSKQGMRRKCGGLHSSCQFNVQTRDEKKVWRDVLTRDEKKVWRDVLTRDEKKVWRDVLTRDEKKVWRDVLTRDEKKVWRDVLTRDEKKSGLLHQLDQGGGDGLTDQSVHDVRGLDMADQQQAQGEEQHLLVSEPIASTLVQLVQKAGLVDTLKQDVMHSSCTFQPCRCHAFVLYSPTVTVNGAKVTDADKAADNGFIHFIDEVIMPPAGSVVTAVSNDPDLSTLLSAITKAGIARGVLNWKQPGSCVRAFVTGSGTDPLTVFAPTNDAFARIDSADLNRLLSSPERLIETLKYHEVPHTLYSKGMWNHEYPKSTDSHEDRLHIRVNSDGVTINNAKVTTADISVTNGVVHKIDHVLIPVRVAFWLRLNNGK